MKTRNLIQATIVGLAVMAAACGRTPAPPPSPASPSATAPATAQPAGPAAAEAIGHYAENLYDRGKLGDWPNAATDASALRNALVQLKLSGAAVDLPALEARVALIEHAVKARNNRLLMQEANDLTRDGAELMRQFRPPVPVEVTLLDYYGRELEMQAQQNDLVGLRETRDQIETVWRAIRPEIEKRGGSVATARFDAQVSQLGQARKAADFAAIATPILDEVDILEAVFAK